MSQAIVANGLQHRSPTKPSRFEVLPTEIRCRIYHYLFPDLQLPFRIDLYAKYLTCSPDDALENRVIRECEDGTHLTVKIFYGSDGQIRPQLENAMFMTTICHTIRTEVVRKVYSNLILAWTSEGSFLEFTNSLIPSTVQLLHRVKVPDIVSQPASKNKICTAMAGLTGLQDVLVRMRPAADPVTKRTAWMPYDLRWLNQLREALPKLSHSHYLEGSGKRGDYECVRLSTSSVAGPSEITFDIDAEYQKWLNAKKQRRIAKQARQTGENGGVA